ncbi:hypothetical protein GDO81_013918 [Engystomops pustulosus]|uniref:THAP-type domain-containing protein n=1 Tax=Engystomops pustulosus TaxID=76066 RepID=A0AAV7B6R9_ENGPU|nr:hypothetical protein GDO81_013918 [Engystomops pustulosus]
MTVCAMFGCKNRMHKGCGKHFFRFPMKDPERLAKWIEAVQRDDWRPSIHSKVCSDHFTEKDYMIRPGAACPYLRMDAVPTPLYPIQRKRKTKKRKYTKKAAIDNVENMELNSETTTQETPSGSVVTYSHEEEMEIQSDVQMEERHEERTNRVEEEAQVNDHIMEIQGVEQVEVSQVEQQEVVSQVEDQEAVSQVEQRRGLSR